MMMMMIRGPSSSKTLALFGHLRKGSTITGANSRVKNNATLRFTSSCGIWRGSYIAQRHQTRLWLAPSSQFWYQGQSIKRMTHATPAGKDTKSVFFEPGATFEQLGLHERLIHAMSRLNKPTPTNIQALVITTPPSVHPPQTRVD